MAINPQQPNILYAGSWGAGVFKSQDGGKSWAPSSSGLGNLYINSMAIDPQNPSVLYAGTYRYKIYKSTDAGQTWFLSSQGIQEGAIIYTIAIDPQNTNRVYIGTRGVDVNSSPPWNGVLYRSTDGGASWSVALSNVGGASAQDWVYSISVLPTSPNEILAASHEHGPYLSTDYGATWKPVNSGINDLSGRATVFDPRFSAPGTAYFGVWHHNGIFKTTNGGASWVSKAGGIGSARIYNMAIDPISPQTVYAATYGGGVMKTTNGGDSWSSMGLSFADLYAVAVNPQNPAILFSGTNGAGLYKSTNGGGSWAQSQLGFTNVTVTAVVARADNNDLLLSTYGSGILKSSVGGSTWVSLNNGLGDLFVHAMVENPAKPSLFYALTDTGGLYQIDLASSANWSKVTSEIPAPVRAGPAYGPDHPFADHAAVIDEPSGLYGTRELAALPASVPLLTMSFAPSNPLVAYLGTAGAGMYKSIDGGIHWNAAGLNGHTVWGMAIDPGNPQLLYAATEVPGGVEVSQDGGATWVVSSLPGLTVYSLGVSPSQPGILYAGTNNGVYQKINSGNWVSIGLIGQSVTMIGAHPARPGYLFVGTASGAFRSTNGGYTWMQAPAELNGLTIQSISFDPHDPVIVYYATKTSGAVKASFHY